MGLGWGRIVALRVSFLLDGQEGESDCEELIEGMVSFASVLET